jgi:dGTPase
MFSVLYRHEKIVLKMHAGKQCIRSLYRAFSEDSGLLPQRQKMLMEIRPPKRVLADYIASMTDRYAIKIYQDLSGFSL